MKIVSFAIQIHAADTSEAVHSVSSVNTTTGRRWICIHQFRPLSVRSRALTEGQNIQYLSI
jgi:hypothetical protein